MSSSLDLYNTKCFGEIYETSTTFNSGWAASGYSSAVTISTTDLTLLFNLLSANFYNSPISGFTESQWKNRLFTTIYTYYPTYITKRDLQKKLRALTDTELMTGDRHIYNSALNDDSTPTTSSVNELAYINSQNSQNHVKNKINAYTSQWVVLRDDLEAELMEKFKPLFLKVVLPQNPIYFESEE